MVDESTTPNVPQPAPPSVGNQGDGDQAPPVPAAPAKPPIWKMDLREADYSPRPQTRDNDGER
jgi:hypothetical protein